MLEIVEHVDDINLFVKQSSKFLKKNGLMFIATLNKTLKSYMFAIVGAEYILKWLPIGTHDWNKFIKPDELIKVTKINNLILEKLDGMNFDLLTNEWNLSSNNSVNYIAKFKKINYHFD
jgi:2-polyprenyl-6-hydroxyphenyl methylase/3-demethylubiquinone-9 3-methyltransferase